MVPSAGVGCDIDRTKAYDKICYRVNGGDLQTIVAFGDGAFSSSSRGQPPGQ